MKRPFAYRIATGNKVQPKNSKHNDRLAENEWGNMDVSNQPKETNYNRI